MFPSRTEDYPTSGIMDIFNGLPSLIAHAVRADQYTNNQWQT